MPSGCAPEYLLSVRHLVRLLRKKFLSGINKRRLAVVLVSAYYPLLYQR